jgi:transcriptional antiterminator Rof (Rho-off)
MCVTMCVRFTILQYSASVMDSWDTHEYTPWCSALSDLESSMGVLLARLSALEVDSDTSMHEATSALTAVDTQISNELDELRTIYDVQIEGRAAEHHHTVLLKLDAVQQKMSHLQSRNKKETSDLHAEVETSFLALRGGRIESASNIETHIVDSVAAIRRDLFDTISTRMQGDAQLRAGFQFTTRKLQHALSILTS